jgi:hypothetical protein
MSDLNNKSFGLLFICILCLLLAGCSGGSGDATGVASSVYLDDSYNTPTASYEETASHLYTAEITNSKTFDPNPLTIEYIVSDYASGGAGVSCWPCPQLTWVNNDDRPHTITSDSGSFDSGPIAPGASWAWTFTQPGDYEYYCSYHDSMVGSVSVVATV